MIVCIFEGECCLNEAEWRTYEGIRYDATLDISLFPSGWDAG